MTRLVILISALLLSACTAFGQGLGMLPNPTPTPPIGSASKSAQLVPNIELYDGWSVTPAMVIASPGCYRNVPESIAPKAQAIVLKTTGLCAESEIRMTSLDRLTECEAVFNGQQFHIENLGVDADCRGHIVKHRYSNAGDYRIVYQIIKKYRPHGGE